MITSRQCVCGVPIPANNSLCVNCRDEYTLDRTLWPEWLQVWMQNYQAELNYERRRGINAVSMDVFDDDGEGPEDATITNWWMDE